MGTWLERLRRTPVLGTAIRTFEKALGDGATDSAASIAYFSFFSLFPLLIGLVAAASFALEPAEVRLRLDEFLMDSLPGSADLVRETVEAVIRLRGPAGILGLVTLLWSASAVFGAASRAVNRAWGTVETSPYYASKMRYIAMCLGAALLFLLSVVVTGFVEVVVGFDLGLLDPMGLTDAIARAGSRLVSFAFLLSMFGLLYKVMPRMETRWRDVWAGALLAGVLFEVGKAFFVKYLDNVANFEAVYGSLYTAIVLLLWLYVSAWILILGAELIDVRREARAEAGW